MKAIRLKAPGGLDHLTMVEIPEAAAPGKGEITEIGRASCRERVSSPV